MALNDLNDFLRGKTLTRGGLCYGSIIYFAFDGGAVETSGGAWSLEIGGKPVETSETVSDSHALNALLGKSIRGVRVLFPLACVLDFWDGSQLRCEDCSHADYGMGKELLNVYRDDPHGTPWICELYAPLGDFSWRTANQPVSASY